jgi:succinoglycan biosynthesis transport protein ExoP
LSDRIREPDIVDSFVEEPVDARRYIEALRRRVGLIAAVSMGVAALVLLISLALPKSYRATALIAPLAQATGPESGSTATPQSLATIQAYVTSPPVFAAAAARIGGESTASLREKITTSLDANANIINVTASDRTAGRAAQLATGVAESFLSVRAAVERAQLAQQEAVLTRRMRAAQAAGSAGLKAALEQQISSVAAQEASAGSDLHLLAAAPVPGSPSSPRPTRNAVFAFVAALFVAVLGVAGRELLAPSISGERELSALIALPILGRVPRVANRRRSRRTAASPAEAEAYRFLSKSLELAVSPRRPCLVAVTSAAREEGKTTVVGRLGAALAETGSRTLLVSADLHWPALHEAFGLPLGSGLSNLLFSLNGRPALAQPLPIHRVSRNLDTLTSGELPPDPTAVLSNDVVQALFERIRKIDCEYVLLDLPPLLAVAETQLFVRHADAVVLVSFVGRTNTEQLAQMRELLDRLQARPAGIVVLGVRGEDRPASYAERFRLLRAARRGRDQPPSPLPHGPAPRRESPETR